MYRISVDIEIPLVRAYLEGFWSADDLEQFMVDEQAAVATLNCPLGKHLLLCDFSKLNVVAQEMVTVIGRELNGTGHKDAAWIAIVITSALLKMQMQRLLTRPNAMIFDDAATAERWLQTVSGYGNIR